MNNDEQLIKLVRECPLLYDRRHEEYKNNNKKAKKWCEIASKISMPVVSVKKKWRNIRDRFLRTQKELNLQSQSGAERKQNNYKYAEELSFLDDSLPANDTSFERFSCINFIDDVQNATHTVFLDEDTVDTKEFANFSSLEAIDNHCTKRRRKFNDKPAISKTKKRRGTKEKCFCNNLATQLQEVDLPIEIFLKFQLEVYQSLSRAIEEKKTNCLLETS